MLSFVFPPHIQAGIASGAYEIVCKSATGQLIGVVRDKITGKFVGNAVNFVFDDSSLYSKIFGNMRGIPNGVINGKISYFLKSNEFTTTI